MTDFWIGDKVRRIVLDNGGDGARIGTIATVTGVDGDGFISVYYHGCFDDEDGFEIWHPRFAELVQEPQHENGKDKEEEPVKNTTTLQDAYMALQEASGIKVGDTVRVIRKARNREMGWASEWASSPMDEYVGETGVVEECYGIYGFRVQFPDGEGWSFPFFVLEKIADSPRFITINGFDVPEPVREPMKMGEQYWVVSITPFQVTPFQDPTSTFCREYPWTYDEFDDLWLRRGLIHRTQEAAEIHARALLSFTEENDDE